MAPLLQDMLQEYGDSSKIIIRNPEKVESLLQALVRDGESKLQVITDFDYTLTRFHKDGERCESCHAIMDRSPLMPEAYRQKADDLFRHYYSIEIDHTISMEEKIPHMVTWYQKSHDLLVEYQASKNKLRDMVNQSKAMLRDSASDVLSHLNSRNVPVLIFSAGVGDIVEEVLHRENVFYPNIKVVSNYMVFNEDGVCVAFKDPLIHMFNKNEAAVGNHSSYFKELSHRNNAIVLGDSLGDLQMSNGMQNPGAILKIGFLNDKIEERKESFVNEFDVVLLDDQTFNLVDIIIRKVVHPSFSVPYLLKHETNGDILVR